MSTSTRLAAAAGALLIAATGAYWYCSPYLAMHSIKQAVESRDADVFNDHVDYPKLRESLKGQFSAMLTREMGKKPASEDSFAQAGAALGTVLGLAFADKFVDAMVRPEMVMKAMAEGKMQDPTARAGTGGNPEGKSEVEWTIDRKGTNRVIAHSIQAGQADKTPAFVFERSGFATWKLTEIRIPE